MDFMADRLNENLSSVQEILKRVRNKRLWFDKIKAELFSLNSKGYVWRKPGTPHHLSNTVHTVRGLKFTFNMTATPNTGKKTQEWLREHSECPGTTANVLI